MIYTLRTKKIIMRNVYLLLSFAMFVQLFTTNSQFEFKSHKLATLKCLFIKTKQKQLLSEENKLSVLMQVRN